MKERIIKNFSELDSWLSENYGFQDGCVLSVNQDSLEIVIGRDVKGNYMANSGRHIQTFKIIPRGNMESTFDRSEIPTGEQNCIESVEALQVEKGVCLEFFTPAYFRLNADNFIIEKQPLVKTIFKPWINQDQIFLTAEFTEIPQPYFWKKSLDDYGHDILFRYFKGDKRFPKEVPCPDYQGYYFQLSDRINSTAEGIFIKHMTIKNGILSCNFEKKDKELMEVWNDLLQIIADFPGVKVETGNCEFTGLEWKKYLNDSVLPN